VIHAHPNLLDLRKNAGNISCFVHAWYLVSHCIRMTLRTKCLMTIPLSGSIKYDGANEYRIAGLMKKDFYNCATHPPHCFGKVVLYDHVNSFRNTTLCIRFWRRTYHLHLQGWRINQAKHYHEAHSKQLITVHYITEIRTLHNHRCDNLRFYTSQKLYHVKKVDPVIN
jgi:hypothetical protein